ncbi:PLP-dependent aminotransferase family protein [Zymobacter sp. IVIA_5232.4 C2]|uniref:aminotransferase-like domain-containing protein n=1 Tax=Zymobacter sp. IVIA_5232.4 C2 TaxID=3394855 RepID=UPI0039C0E661
MAAQQAIWIPDIRPFSHLPTYLALVEAIAAAIRCGELKAGDRLPPQRRLAWAMDLNPSTTLQAYREASRRHLISGEVGRGTYVLADSQEASLFRLRTATVAATELIDLTTNVPILPLEGHDMRDTLHHLADDADAHSGWVNYLTDADALQGELLCAQWMREVRQMEVPPDQFMLCPGAQKGLLAVLMSFCHGGDPVLVEALTAPGIRSGCRQLRLPLHDIRMDSEGILPEELDRMARSTGARVALLTPILQNPTGTTMTVQRQHAIAEVVAHHDLLVIEDDVYGGLSDVPPLTRLLGHRGILVSSLSKTVAPGLRFGFIHAQPERLAQIDPDTQLTRWGMSPLMLGVARHWIEHGIAQHHLRHQRQATAQRWQLAQRLLGHAMLMGTQPSPHIWAHNVGHLPQLAQACETRGVKVTPENVFAIHPHTEQAVRISLSAAPDMETLEKALRLIAPLFAPPTGS